MVCGQALGDDATNAERRDGQVDVGMVEGVERVLGLDAKCVLAPATELDEPQRQQVVARMPKQRYLYVRRFAVGELAGLGSTEYLRLCHDACLLVCGKTRSRVQ